MTIRILAAVHDPALLVFGLFAIVTLILVIVAKLKHNAFIRTCEEVAEQLGGEYVPAEMFQEAAIQFRIQGRAASIQPLKGRDPTTTVTVNLGRSVPGTLRIVEETLGQSILKLFGAQDVLIGDAGFDDHYVVKAMPETLAAKVFAPERRARVTDSVRRLKGLSRPAISLGGGELVVRVKRRLDDAASMMMLAQTAIDFTDYLLHLEPEVGIEWVAGLETSGHCCPVCSALLRDPVVRCEDCGVPHHEECWTWLGKCSIYACEGKRPRRFAA